ncbi:MAG: alpha-L-fucosidase [Clostridia bacterium]|nr:alpha-L-fucosidase [Clostridia bacterium]
MSWTKDNYRRNFLDMHIADWHPDFMSKFDADNYVKMLKAADVQSVVLKGKSHTGLNYWKSSVGERHKNLRDGDFFGETLKKLHEADIKVVAYYSLIFDNWAYENHPDWRMVDTKGNTSREPNRTGCGSFRNGRYGLVCPNNKDYRAYVTEHIQEMCRNYEFEGMFLDMGFWPFICTCDSCRKRYREEIGAELPEYVDWTDERWLTFQKKREQWLAEFIGVAAAAAKQIRPEVTIEHQFSGAGSDYVFAVTEQHMEHADYAGGDYYGGYLQQTFINKLYRNITPTLPFNHHTGRCDPNLGYHTTTKTDDELLLHCLLALVHEGAFCPVDAANPDGTLDDKYYAALARVYSKSQKYQGEIGGELIADVGIYYTMQSKIIREHQGVKVEDIADGDQRFIDAKLRMADILRDNNIAFDVVTRNRLDDLSKYRLMILTDCLKLDDDEVQPLLRFVENGGTLWVDGTTLNKKLASALGLSFDGETKEKFTYIAPTKEGEKWFPGFDVDTPMSVPMRQPKLESAKGEILATITLPYTDPDDPTKFSAIHSNPPGVHTDIPATFIMPYGKGKIFWCSIPLAVLKPGMSRIAVGNILENLLDGGRTVLSNAPAQVEVISFDQPDRKRMLVSVFNELERAPYYAIHEISVDVKSDKKPIRITDVEDGSAIPFDYNNGWIRFSVPPVKVAKMMAIEFE